MIVTIPRQEGTEGAQVAMMVADRLGIHVFDHEVLDEIARRFQVDQEVLEHFDETILNPVESVIWEWRTSVNEQVYFRYLRQALEHIGAAGNCVILGRGANFVLAGPDTLRVRIIAPQDMRVARYAERHGKSNREAAREVKASDRHRADFVRAMYNAAIDAPEHYDLVVNIGKLSLAEAADIILSASRLVQQRRKLPEAQPPKHVETMTRPRRQTKPNVVEHEENHQQ